MKLHLQFRRYCLPFRAPVRTAHGWWREREGLIVQLANDGGVIGYGEAAPIPHFGTETVDEAEAAVRALGEWTTAEALAEVPARLGCVRHALAAAQAGGGTEEGNGTIDTLGVAALLPAGRAAIAALRERGEGGFRVFKWKVGVGDLADELALLDDVCAELPPGGKLRLDANGAWDRRQAERWLERCADRPIEYVEQPCFATAAQGLTWQRKADDLLLGLAGDFPTPLAIDESLVGEGDVERWIGMGWPGVFVIKPALLGDVVAVMGRLAAAKASVVFSSALETAVGAQAALRVAFQWRGATDAANGPAPRALGFGVWPLLADARFDGPRAAPFLRRSDVEAIRPEDVWSGLS
jgi:O-succinylbenzoate synthase